MSTENVKYEKAIAGTPVYMAPEIYRYNRYGKASDVYAFALIAYEILINENVFKTLGDTKLLMSILNGDRPPFDHEIPICYKKLITNCWDEDPEKRPSFNEIVELLKTDPDFILDTVDQDEYYKYVDFIDDVFSSSTDQNEQKSLMEKTFKKVCIDLSMTEDKFSENDPELKKAKKVFVDLEKYEKVRIVSKGSMYNFYEIRNKETYEIFTAKITTFAIENLKRDDILKLSREINTISQINHPTILKFIGYSLTDFNKKKKPVIITELLTKGVLSEILSKEREGESILNSTNKLILIYGIAFGMSFLHSHNILHRSLTPDSIFIDDDLYPKIGNFELSTHIHTLESMTLQSTRGFKGNPEYSAPEVLQNNDYSKESDVYSFAFLVYEIMTNDVSFKNIKNTSQFLIDLIVNEKRPEIKSDLPESYKKLIEISWSQNPFNRPSFDEIVIKLKEDDGFIVDGVDVEKFKNYIEYIEKAQIEFFDSKKVVQINEHDMADSIKQKNENLQISSSSSTTTPLKNDSGRIKEIDVFNNESNKEPVEELKRDLNRISEFD